MSPLCRTFLQPAHSSLTKRNPEVYTPQHCCDLSSGSTDAELFHTLWLSVHFQYSDRVATIHGNHTPDHCNLAQTTLDLSNTKQSWDKKNISPLWM